MVIIPGEIRKNIIIDTPQRKKNRRLLIILFGVIILTGGIFYFGFGGSNQPATTPGVSVVTEQEINRSNKILEELNSITLNNAIFTDNKFQSLISSEELPTAVGTRGREDPFSPF